VETTTGPLGQGLANAVGMALAEKLLADEFNRPGHTIVDHRTYVFVGDGCLMEGISHEACSLAGVLGLNKLVALYDDNGISIDGPVARLVRRRHRGALRRLWLERHRPGRRPRRRRGGRALGAGAQAHADRPDADHLPHHHRPGSPARAGTAKAHGEPLGADEIAATRAAIGWPHAPFELPPEVRGLGRPPRGRRRATGLGRQAGAYRAATPAGRRVRAPHGGRAAAPTSTTPWR
jgi:transketolase